MAADRDYYRRKLAKYLGFAFDESFLTMCWATHAVQSGRANLAERIFHFPPEAITEELTSPWKIHPWSLETLANELLTIPKGKQLLPRRRILDCSRFEAMRGSYNALHGLENAEDALTLRRISVLNEMHRLAQRQIEWQRGFWTSPQLYRSAFIYGGETTLDYFARTQGYSFKEFSLACTLFLGLFQKSPVVIVNGDALDLSKAVLERVMARISLPIGEARAEAARLRKGTGHTAYKASLFRMYPVIKFDERFISPLPELIAVRCTTGMFYDVVSGSDPVRAEIGARFAAYCREHLASSLGGLDVVEEYNYAVRRGVAIDSPDILLREGGELSVVFECKATRMSFDARFSEAPMVNGDRGYKEIAKGVFQIWRFVSHIRRGLVIDERLRADARGVVLTLDTWLTAANQMQREVLKLAQDMAATSDPEVLECDRIGVIFCPVSELEMTLARATPSSFLAAVRAATDTAYEGWFLSSVHDQVAPGARQTNPYPFTERIGKVLAWWAHTNDR